LILEGEERVGPEAEKKDAVASEGKPETEKKPFDCSPIPMRL
jgi:hypothetical protein